MSDFDRGPLSPGDGEGPSVKRTIEDMLGDVASDDTTFEEDVVAEVLASAESLAQMGCVGPYLGLVREYAEDGPDAERVTVAARRAFVRSLKQLGWPNPAIAGALEVPTPTVVNDLIQLRAAEGDEADSLRDRAAPRTPEQLAAFQTRVAALAVDKSLGRLLNNWEIAGRIADEGGAQPTAEQLKRLVWAVANAKQALRNMGVELPHHYAGTLPSAATTKVYQLLDDNPSMTYAQMIAQLEELDVPFNRPSVATAMFRYRSRHEGGTTGTE